MLGLPKKRSKSLSLSDVLLRKLNRLWYEEVKMRIGRGDRLSFSEFVENLLWEAIKRRNGQQSSSQSDY